jgi:hypothetical protein
MERVWFVADAINTYFAFANAYPTKDHDKQQSTATGFSEVSSAGFDCCTGTIDGRLIKVHKPSRR